LNDCPVILCTLALIVTASFCDGVRRKRYSGKQVPASKIQNSSFKPEANGRTERQLI